MEVEWERRHTDGGSYMTTAHMFGGYPSIEITHPKKNDKKLEGSRMRYQGYQRRRPQDL